MWDLMTLRRGFTALTSAHLVRVSGACVGEPQGQPTARY